MRRHRMSPRQRFRLLRSLLALVLLVSLLVWGVKSIQRYNRQRPMPLDQPPLVNLYLRDASGMLLVPVTRPWSRPRDVASLDSPPAQAAQDTVNGGPSWSGEQLLTVLEELRRSYPGRGLYSPLPAGSQFVAAVQQGDQVHVELRLPEKAQLGTRSESLLAGSIVSTLTDLAGVRSVQLSLTDPQGTLEGRLHLDFSQPLTREIWMNSWYTADGPQAGDADHVCTVYWRLPNSGFLAPVSLPTKEPAGLESCLQILAQGPDPARRRFVDPSIPADWQVKLLEKPAAPEFTAVVEVGLPTGFNWDQPAPLAYLQTVIPATVLTMTEMKVVQAVRIRTRGSTPTGSLGGYNVDQAIHRPRVVNRLWDGPSVP